MPMFIGGRDTKPEVDALLAGIQPTPGSHVSHADAAEIAGVDVGSNRFVTVTSRWRKWIEKNTGTRIQSRDGVFHFLTADEALDMARVDVHKIGRATGKAHVRVSAIDTASLSDVRKSEHVLMQRTTAAMLDNARRSAKEIALPKPVTSGNVRLAK